MGETEAIIYIVLSLVLGGLLSLFAGVMVAFLELHQNIIFKTVRFACVVTMLVIVFRATQTVINALNQGLSVDYTTSCVVGFGVGTIVLIIGFLPSLPFIRNLISETELRLDPKE